MNKKKLKVNKKQISIIISLIALVIGIIAFNLYNNKSSIPETDKYEILDENILSTDEMKEWLQKKSEDSGVFTKSDEEYTYVLISHGKTKKPNIGICLEDISFNNKVNIKYSIISSESEYEVEEYTPKMILRLKGPDIKVKYDKINPS